MQASVVERQLSHFVGLRLTALYEEALDVQAEMRKTLLSRQYELSALINPDEQLSVTLPNETEQAEDTVTSYIGFEVSKYKDVPQDMVALELAGGRYAQFPYKGALDSEEFEAFYPAIFAWLQQQDLAPSESNPWIEIYGRHNDWDNRSDPLNEVTALIPLGGAAR